MDVFLIVVEQANYLVPIWIISLLIATYIGVQRGFPFLGFLNGLMLGPLGLLIVMIQDDNRRRPCPYCSESIMKSAMVCPHCQRNLNEVVS